MRRAGVPLLAGTDAPNPLCFLGFSLHEELALLVGAALSPMEALQSATRSPAAYLGALDSYGTVETGKTADLVILDANPLVNIRNTRKIAGVMVGGKLFPKPALDTMLTDAELSPAGSRLVEPPPAFLFAGPAGVPNATEAALRNDLTGFRQQSTFPGTPGGSPAAG